MATSKDKQTQVIDQAFAASLLPTRSINAHKWDVGGLAIFGGSPGYLGAPALAALGAGRSGAGIVIIACPRGAAGAIATIVPEATFFPLPEAEVTSAGHKLAEKLRERTERVRAFVVGPGLGTDEYADGMMQILTGAYSSPVHSTVGFSVTRTAPSPTASDVEGVLSGDRPSVIDADALNWLSKNDGWSTKFAADSLVLTPHIGEMARLTGLSVEEIVANPQSIAQDYAKRWGQTVVLKGAPTVVASSDRIAVARSSQPALATAGSGDVLAGSIGAFLAQGLSPFDAAALAVFIGTEAAATLVKTFSTFGVIASDLPPAIAAELAKLEQL